MADKKISQLDSTSSVNSDAVFPLSQTESGSLKTVKGTVDQVGDYIAKTQDHSTLNTVSKKIIGAINEILESGIGDIEGTASGSVASFNDGGDNIPVKSLVVDITAVQAGEGTPSPSNEREISGFDNVEILHSGKNFFDKSTIIRDKNLIWASGDIGSTETGSWVSDFIFVKPHETYIASNALSQVFAYDSTQTAVYVWKGSGWSALGPSGNSLGTYFTIPEGISYIRFSRRYTEDIDADVASFQVEKGTSHTTYETYKGTTYTISLGQTVYGGTLDVTKGILTVTHGIYQFSTCNSTGVIGNSYYAYDTRAEYNPSDIVAENWSAIVCDRYNTAYSTGERTNGTCYSTTAQRVIFVDDRFTSLANAETILASEKPIVVYPLATPIVIQLTPTEVRTLLGENNIYANSGDVEVEYFNEGASQFNDLIETIITSSSSDYHVYSTNEKVVGRWIDGKPIYEKTFTNIAVQSSLSQLVDDSVSYGTLIDGSINIANGVGFAYVQDNDIFLRAYVNSNKLYVAKRQATDWAGSSYAFIYVRYTKSTD